MSTRVSMQRSRTVVGFDWVLALLAVLLFGFGLLNLHSASVVDGRGHDSAQMLNLAIGLLPFGLLAYLDYRHIERLAYFVYGASCLLLVVTLLVGIELNGSRRWLDLGPLHLQSSEFAKVALVVVTARYFSDRYRGEPLGLRDVLPLVGLYALPVLLILKQPDLGTALAVLFAATTIWLVERIALRTWVSLFTVGLIGAPFFWFFGMHDYQRTRVLSFISPDEGLQAAAWQVNQSRIAIGSGGFWGKGYLNGTQVQNGFVPEHENDFIFTHHGEQFGFIGSLVLLMLFLALLLWCLRIARQGRDRFAVLTAVGLAAFFFWHVVINLGMVTGMLPVVGLWLPMISYGGSAALTVMTALGLLMSISIRRHVF